MRSGTLVARHVFQPRQCISCPPTPPCNCNSNQTCYQINRDCNTCGSFKCVDNNTVSGGSGGSGGISKGALAGAIVGALVALAAAIVFFLWYRHRRGLRAAAMTEAKVDVPAPAEDVLNRRDPSEKLSSRPPTELTNTRVYSTHSDGTIDLDPESQRASSGRVQSHRASTQSNPFSDGHSSIQTMGSTGTDGVNVIPIAFVPPGSMSTLASTSTSGASENHPLTPVRPARSPELDLAMGRVNVSREEARLPYAPSQISGISGVSSRNSYISNMSFSSEFLNEAPVIVTPTQGGIVRQVIGSVKAEMVNASGPSTSMGTAQSGTSLSSRPSVRSPLAANSFGPSDVLREHEEEPALPVRSPFDDENTSRKSTPSSFPSSGTPSPNFTNSTDQSTISSELLEPNLPWAQPGESSRPSSMSTQAGSIIANIGSATRVNVGLGGLQSGSTLPSTPSTPGQNPRSPYRTTMARLINPSSTENLGTLEQQQQRALDHAQAQAQAQSGGRSRRVSGSSAISNTADSILESFPFVPPSPISDRPIRSPPRSPLNQPPLNQPTFNKVAETKAPTSSPSRPPPPPEPLNPPKNRRALGMSTGSQLSTASSGLGSFPFQIDSYPPQDSHGSTPPSAFAGRQRASLDTLALTSDLSSYPLGYDRAELRDSYPTSS